VVALEVIPVDRLEEVIEKVVISSEAGSALEFWSPHVEVTAASVFFLSFMPMTKNQQLAKRHLTAIKVAAVLFLV